MYDSDEEAKQDFFDVNMHLVKMIETSEFNEVTMQLNYALNSITNIAKHKFEQLTDIATRQVQSDLHDKRVQAQGGQ